MAITEPESFATPDVTGIEDLLATFLNPDRPYLADSEISDGVQALDRVRCLVDAAMTAGVDRLDGRQVYGFDGARSAAAWLRPRTELSAANSTELVHRARDLRDCPHVAAAFNNAILGVAKVRMLLAARNGLEDQFADFEATLVALIRNLTVEHARIAINKWRRKAEAAKAEDDDTPPADPEDENEAHLSAYFQGRVRLDAEWDPVTGQMITDAVNARINDMFRTGAATKVDGIKHSRRLAQALAELILGGAEAGATKHGAPRPSITLNLDLAALLALPINSPEELLARACGLTNGTPILPSTAERLLCDADVTAIFTRLGLGGIVEPLGAVHSNRYPSAVERKALALRDQGCVFPGCDAPVDWSDAHHLDHWHLHQRTELSRLVLLCRFHHHCVHEGGYTLERSHYGTITVTRPDGSPLPRTKPGQQILTPDQPGRPPGTAMPPRRATIPARTATRFQAVAPRQDAIERQLHWLNQLTRLRLDPLGVEIEHWLAETGDTAA